MICVALKTPLQMGLGIFIYKTSLLHRPDDYIGFTLSCPPTFYNKIAPMLRVPHDDSACSYFRPKSVQWHGIV